MTECKAIEAVGKTRSPQRNSDLTMAIFSILTF